jgi:arginine N-succinyltransferase
MFLLRSVEEKDLPDLLALAQLANFISLPPSKKSMLGVIQNALQSFRKPSSKLSLNNYLFVLENLEDETIVGVSLIHSQHGTEEEPHFFLRVGQEHKYSRELNTGFVHGVLKLGYETHGPTEIGGLVLSPESRNHPDKLGKQLSFGRFLFMAKYPERFRPEIHCELLPPFDEHGNSPLWEAIGRRFMNMDYHEADLLSRQNKEFILNLYPSNTIYVTLLPIEARNAIGKVGAQTAPVKKMLESVGFKYIQEVDPFDGGPHYRCQLKEIIPIRQAIITRPLVQEEHHQTCPSSDYLIEIPSAPHTFKAAKTKVVSIEGHHYIEKKLVQHFPEILKHTVMMIPLDTN